MIKLDRPLCIFDLEATGVSPLEDRIVDVCVLRKNPDGTESVFSSLVNPGVPIPPEASAIHKITDDMVRDQPRMIDLAPKLLEVFAGADLGGFNAAKYDIPLLAAELKRCGIDWPVPGARVVDSFVIFQRKERRDLTAAYKFYCGKDLTGAHRAEADVRATAEIMWAQAAHYADLPKDVAGLEAFCNQIDPSRVDQEGKFVWKNGEAAFGFGNKHKGKTLREVVRADRGYLQWMVEKGNFSQDVQRICREALEGKFPEKKG
ncbi:MAG: 3'-5' exonuclease [Elusimicrobiota bacterium]|nr:MAG: 3'-5' exonuclease [Elusimicrobiota bacterium]